MAVLESKRPLSVIVAWWQLYS